MAGRPALPKNVHKIKGTAKKHPERMRARENEPENTNPLGEPPKHLTRPERSAWDEISRQAIEGVLGEADRIAVELAACLLVKMRGQKIIVDPKTGKRKKTRPGPQDHNQFFKYLSQFGMLPADRSKLSIPPKPEKNRFDDD
jgi:hypothetical protein